MDGNANIYKCIVAQLDNQEYAIPVEKVGAIERKLHMTRVPKTAPCVKGVINLRGVITPIVHLRERFGMTSSVETNESNRIIIVHMENYDVGLIVDAAYDVLDIPQNKLEPAPQVIGAVDVDYIKGVAQVNDRLIMLLDLEKVLDLEALQTMKGKVGQLNG